MFYSCSANTSSPQILIVSVTIEQNKQPLHKPTEALEEGQAPGCLVFQGLKPESKLAPSAGSVLTSSSMQSLVVYILMHNPPVCMQTHVYNIYMSTHTHIPQALANMASMHTDTHVYKIHVHVHTRANKSSMHKDVCTCTQIHIHTSSTNTPSILLDGDVCNTGICVHVHTKTHENT